MKVVLDKGAILPTRAHEFDAGLDIYTPRDVTVPPVHRFLKELKPTGNNALNVITEIEIGSATIDTGVHVEIPKGAVGMIKSKSGLNVHHGLTGEGVIDCGYTGSIVVKLYNASSEEYHFKAGDKIAQLVVLPCFPVSVEEVDKLEETERGSDGFGSTGK